LPWRAVPRLVADYLLAFLAKVSKQKFEEYEAAYEKQQKRLTGKRQIPLDDPIDSGERHRRCNTRPGLGAFPQR
jgi:hypothetical protein